MKNQIKSNRKILNSEKFKLNIIKRDKTQLFLNFSEKKGKDVIKFKLKKI